MKIRTALTCLFLAGMVQAAAPDRAMEVARAEFSKYHRMITGCEAPEARFAVDPALDASFDEYRIVSEGDSVAFLGGNQRAVLYAVYDFLARRGGCRWFWDGDKVPKRARLDFSGLDVREKSQFLYRGLRYFAHRGLTRFQAEHWGYEDWKREIDWAVKNRLNLFMLRIGQDDLFQKAFPDIVSYPDPAKPLPEAMPGYNNRSLFWSLQYRGELRRKVLDYAFERGMMHPEDFGTMSHWYSRTPYAFLEKMKPPFIPQQGGSYGHDTDRVWDVRDRKWLDCYWKITEASIANYGKPDILHTIGLGERRCSTNRAENTKMKIDVLNLNLAEARRLHPDSLIALAGWDFYQEWRPEEIRGLFAQLDWKNLILWDYEADATRDYRRDMKGLVNNFTKWDVVGKYPYTFGIFLCLEQGIDCRADYDVLETRQKAIKGDAFCKGYVFWPESSHTDTFLLHYFTRNGWRAGERGVPELLAEFCADRYGDQAEAFRRAWQTVIPVASPIGWSGNYGSRCTYITTPGDDIEEKTASRAVLAERFRTLFSDLAALDHSEPSALRDTIDLARTAGDRLAVATRMELVNVWRAWRNGKADAAAVKDAARRYVALGAAMADLLELHTDFSLYESYMRLESVEHILNPAFDRVLFDNATCPYCRSHQAEAARHWYLPTMRLLADTIVAKVDAGDKSGYKTYELRKQVEAMREALMKRPLFELRPTLPRTEENLKRALLAFEM